MNCKIVSISEVPQKRYDSAYREVVESAIKLLPDQALEYDLQELGVKAFKFRERVYNAARLMRIYNLISVKTSESRAWVFRRKSQIPSEEGK